MKIIVLYGIGTNLQKYKRTFFKKYPFFIEQKIAVVFRSLYNKVETGITYDALYADTDTMSTKRDKNNLERYMKHYASIPRRIFSLTNKGKLKTHVVGPVKEFKQ